MPEEIAAHEPRLAFDGGPFGIRILRRIVSEAPAFLAPGGWLAVEVGRGQGPAMLRSLGNHPEYAEATPVCDRDGAIRAVLARTRAARDRKGEQT
ncbi:MAG TPA: hypothetical protein VLS49_04975, partial [Usitatibacter sp.]|nr:hypothetical protein [Usitatibacter sp.]